MNQAPEKIIVLEENSSTREELEASLHSAGYNVSAFATASEALNAIHQDHSDLLLLDTNFRAEPAATVHETVAAIRGSTVTEGIRIILLVGSAPEERTAALDLGADDAISRPWDLAELLARVRAQLRVRHKEDQLLEKMHIAEEGQQIAHTAFEALAVTEKMTKDAFSLDRRLKFVLAAVLVIAILMGGIYFGFVRTAQKQQVRVNAAITRLYGSLMNQQELMAQARKLRETQVAPEPEVAGKEELRKQSADLKAKLSGANGDEVATLQKQLADTDARLKRIEQQGDSAQSLIPVDVQSVCLLHVLVAFRDMQSGQRLRYAGLNPQGGPIQDSGGNPIFTLEGSGPEVKLDVFGTGFVAGSSEVITNRHVAQPWWKNDDFSSLTDQGLQPEISSIRAYFPGDPRSFTAEIQEISKETDLATMRINMQGLQRPILSVDSSKGAAAPGEPIILMGYATGLAGILARADDATAQQIMSGSSGDMSQVMDQLAQRNLIRPIITQGHIGDVLPDKIVFDAQTTSGGSGGPLFNQQGKVIGVTYAVLKGFGGSNFGIPIRLSEPLLGAHP